MSGIASAIDAELAVPLETLPVEAIRETAAEFFRQAARLEAAAVRALGEFESRATAEQLDGSALAAGWLAARLRSTYGWARGRVLMARRLRCELPETAASIAAGDITIAHAQVLTSVPAGPVADAVAERESTLLEAARTLAPDLLARVVKHLAAAVQPDGTDRDAARQYEDRRLFLSEVNGVRYVDGVLDQESGEIWETALTAEMAADRQADDRRTKRQRRADAATSIFRRYLEQGDAPRQGGTRPHIWVIVAEETLRRERTQRRERTERIAELLLSGAIPDETARRHACDGVFSRIVLDPRGLPLDVGRETPMWTPAQRRAVIVRDGGGCRWRGCRRSVRDCDIHHVVYSSCGGTTDIANGVLLCWFHHKQVHEGGRPLDLRPITAPLGSYERAPPEPIDW